LITEKHKINAALGDEFGFENVLEKPKEIVLEKEVDLDDLLETVIKVPEEKKRSSKRRIENPEEK